MSEKTTETPRTITQFEHENSLMHYGMVNRRSMIMLITVCVTLVLTTAIFVTGYTIRETVREKHWLDTLNRLIPSYTEVADGGHQQPDP